VKRVPERRTDVDRVDWAALHADGPWADVPAALHAAWSADADRRRHAYDLLVDRLTGQGTRTPAGAAAAPFLIDIVADPEAPDRFGACQVLRQIAIGDEQAWLVEQPDTAAERGEVARTATLTVADLRAEEAAWVAAAADKHERQARDWHARTSDVEADRRARRWNMEAYDAVRAGVPAYLAALAAADAGTRLYAAHLLAYFPEDRWTIVPALRRMIAGDPDPIAASVACVAAGLCAQGAEDRPLLAALAKRRDRSEHLAERWSAAIGLGRATNYPGLDVVVEIEQAAEATAPVPHWPFLDGDIAAVASLTLDRLAPAG
jgi:hypothetical protein